MADAAAIPLPYPEAAVVDEETLEEQVATPGAHAAGAAARPRRVLLLARRRDPRRSPHVAAGSRSSGWTPTAISTRPRASPSGNAWGMPLRIAIDEGAIAPADVALVGARNLDPPEVAYMRRPGSTTTSSAPSSAAIASTSRSTSTCSVPASSPSSCRSPAGRRWPRSRRFFATLPARLPLAGLGTDGTARRRRPGGARRPRRRGRPLAAATSRREGGSKMAQMSATDKIDVSIEHKKADPDGGDAKKHPNTCPGCGSHYRDDELRAHLRVCPQCGHHFPVRGSGADRAARRRGHVRRGRDVAQVRRPRSTSST